MSDWQENPLSAWVDSGDGNRDGPRFRGDNVSEPFGWMKTIAGGRKLRFIGRQGNRAWVLMTGAVNNTLRITALEPATT